MNTSQLFLLSGFTFIIAAIVGPEEFGKFAIFMVMISLIQRISGGFFVAVIIKNQIKDNVSLNSIFLVLIFLSFVFSVFTIYGAEYWGGVNGIYWSNEQVEWLCALIILPSICVIPRAILLRDQRFKVISINQAIASVLGGGLGIYYASLQATFMAFLIQIVVTELLTTVLFFISARFFPEFKFSILSLTKICRDAFAVLLNELGGFTQSRIDTILIGLLFSPLAVGLYRIADRIIQICMTVFTRSISIFLLSDGSKSADGHSGLNKSYQFNLRASMSLVGPALGVLAGTSEYTLLVLGDRWYPAAAGLSVMCLVGLSQSVSILTPQYLLIAGKAMWGAYVTWFSSVVLGSALALSWYISNDLDVGLQLAVVAGVRAFVSFCIILPLNVILVGRASSYNKNSFLRDAIPPFAAFVVGASVCFTLTRIVGFEGVNYIFATIFVGGIGTIVSYSVVILFDKDLRNAIRRKFSLFE